MLSSLHIIVISGRVYDVVNEFSCLELGLKDGESKEMIHLVHAFNCLSC